MAQVSENRYEWILVDLAVHLARGVHVAIHASLSGQQIAHQIADSGARIVLLSTAEQAGKLAAAGISLPPGLQFFSYDSMESTIAEQPVLPLTELFAAIGKDSAAQIQHEAVANTKPSDLATILYTSGTTGEAKGVMLSHNNLASNAIGCCTAFDTTIQDVRLAWLPFSHIFARTCDLYTWLVRGSPLAIVEDREHIISGCQQIHPTLINGVPYFFEKVKQGLTDAGKARPHRARRAHAFAKTARRPGAGLLQRRRRAAGSRGGVLLPTRRAAAARLRPDGIVARDFDLHAHALQNRHLRPGTSRRGNSHRRGWRNPHRAARTSCWAIGTIPRAPRK